MLKKKFIQRRFGIVEPLIAEEINPMVGLLEDIKAEQSKHGELLVSILNKVTNQKEAQDQLFHELEDIRDDLHREKGEWSDRMARISVQVTQLSSTIRRLKFILGGASIGFLCLLLRLLLR